MLKPLPVQSPFAARINESMHTTVSKIYALCGEFKVNFSSASETV
jgi:hypothetical protein